ncbi:MAG: SurA N-terminal domain-containing protein [Treponema sp.]|jgi:hypothetical protein|nr:SurA N-terminal domain-containing protein [Treponema sp.]
MAQKNKKTQAKDIESPSSEIGRKFRQNPFLFIGTVIILVLVTVSFVLVPIFVPESSNTGDLTFGYYDKIPITWIPGNILAQYRDQLAEQYRTRTDISEYQKTAIVWRQAFEGAVAHTAILQLLKRSNYAVPKKTVDREVARLSYFQENGRFSSALYNQMSESARLAIWRQVQDEIAKTMFYNDFFSLLIPKGEAEFIGSINSPMRTFEMVYFNVDNYPEDEYLVYARENSNLFRTIHLSRISINSSEREAGRILESVKNGTSTFEDAARAQSQDGYADRGGDMGIRYSYELESEIPNSADREMIFRLGRGELSNIIRIGEEWVFFRIEDELKQADFEDEFVMERVRLYLRNYDRGRMEDRAIAQAREFISDAQLSSFDNAARWRNMEIQSFGPLPLNYGSIDIFTSLESFTISDMTQIDLQNLSRNENFWRIAFSTQLNNPSEPLVQGNHVIVLLPVEQIDAEESVLENTALLYSSYWLNYISEQSLQYYFMGSDKVDDRFWDIFFQYLM